MSDYGHISQRLTALASALASSETKTQLLWSEDVSDAQTEMSDSWSQVSGPRNICHGSGFAPQVPVRAQRWFLPPASDLVGAITGPSAPYLRKKTTTWMLGDTRITQLATNTTVGTSTRHDTASKTIYAPETAERAFESVRLIITFRTEWAATNQVTGHIMGIKLGSGPTVDFIRNPNQPTTASRNVVMEIDADITEYFQQYFGTGTSQTCVASFACANTTGAFVNQITFRLEMTYAFDPNVSTTRIKTMRIPIQSMGTFLSTSQAEVGADGNNPFTSQVPALDTFLPELSKVYRQIFFDMTAHDGNVSGTTAFTPYIQIDATAEVARATIDVTINMFSWWRDQYDLTALITTNATHTISFRTDLNQRLPFIGGFIIVTYEYNHATTVANNLAIYEAIVPMSESNSDYPPTISYASIDVAGAGTPATNIAGGSRWIASLNVAEPGTPTVVQSAAVIGIDLGSSGGGLTMLTRIGNQAMRTWLHVAAASGVTPAVLRTDAIWTLQRGDNKLNFDIVGLREVRWAYAVINYTAGVNGDVDNGAHPVNYVCHTYDNLVTVNGVTSPEITREAWGLRPPVLTDGYSVTAAMIEANFHQGGNLNGEPFLIEQMTGELDVNWSGNMNPCANSSGLFGSNRGYYNFLRSVNTTPLQSGKIDLTKRRRMIAQATPSWTGFAAWSWWVTYRSMSWTVSGLVKIAGVAVPDGKTVKIYATDASGVTEFIVSVLTMGGTGLFSTPVYDNVRTYFATYNDGAFAGKSLLGTPV